MVACAGTRVGERPGLAYTPTMISSRLIGRVLRVALAAAFALPAGRVVAASDVWSRPVATAATISACAPGSLPIGLGCLRIGGAVETSMAVAAVPSWQGTLATPRVDRTAPSTLLSRPAVAARLSADVRVPTELGPVRAYISVRNLPTRRADGF